MVSGVCFDQSSRERSPWVVFRMTFALDESELAFCTAFVGYNFGKKERGGEGKRLLLCLRLKIVLRSHVYVGRIATSTKVGSW